jgi:hypothetical protein
MIDNDDPEPRKPEPPDPGDCCGGGCVRCVLTMFTRMRWSVTSRRLLRGRRAIQIRKFPNRSGAVVDALRLSTLLVRMILAAHILLW